METDKKIIGITRPSNRIPDIVNLIESYNGEPFVASTLELELVNSDSLKNLISKLDELDWLIFTSVTSLESIFKFYPDFLDDLNSKCQIAVIGHKTAEVAINYKLPVDIIPENYTAEGLLEEFENIDLKNKIIGIPRTFSARATLPEGLNDMGGTVLLGETYKSILPHDTEKIELLIEKIINNEIDAITFTSPLTVTNLFEVVKEDQKDELIMNLSKNILTVSIGPITGKTLDKFNIRNIYPETFTVKDMIKLTFEKL